MYSIYIYIRVYIHILICYVYYTRRPCPDGFVLGSLKPHHTPLVVKHWDRLRGWPKEMSYYEGLISNFESRALYSVDDLDSPVTWSLQHVYGSIGDCFR